jgi:hypothetical protein
MSGLWHRLLQLVIGYPVPWEEHADNVATAFYCRGLAQNITMVGFLGEYCFQAVIHLDATGTLGDIEETKLG